MRGRCTQRSTSRSMRGQLATRTCSEQNATVRCGRAQRTHNSRWGAGWRTGGAVRPAARGYANEWCADAVPRGYTCSSKWQGEHTRFLIDADAARRLRVCAPPSCARSSVGNETCMCEGAYGRVASCKRVHITTMFARCRTLTRKHARPGTSYAARRPMRNLRAVSYTCAGCCEP